MCGLPCTRHSACRAMPTYLFNPKYQKLMEAAAHGLQPITEKAVLNQSRLTPGDKMPGLVTRRSLAGEEATGRKPSTSARHWYCPVVRGEATTVRMAEEPRGRSEPSLVQVMVGEGFPAACSKLQVPGQGSHPALEGGPLPQPGPHSLRTVHNLSSN